VLTAADGSVIAEVTRPIGAATNNVAEYTALVTGLELALSRGVSTIEVCVDSELVVSQVEGRWKIRNDRLRSLAATARALLGRFDEAALHHVPRENNARADALANEAMDSYDQRDDTGAQQGSLLDGGP
jgi:ribonuclease HI